ncbi:MAG: hypothetical protein J6X24_10490 [Firmicutes bacterium]|nr:hypothetical protein [Bacillota bacterium]
MNTEPKPLSVLRIGLIYTGCLVGAGFASGREAWQFFGVFGKMGYAGAAVATLLYIGVGLMTVTIAHRKNTGDVSALINPTDNKPLNTFVGVMMCFFLLVAYVALTAAGGALLESKTGLSHAVGSLVICLLCIITALGGFSSISDKAGKISPVLVAGTLVLGIYLIATNTDQVADLQPHRASKVAGHWLTAVVSYVGYNASAAVPVLGQCAMHSDSPKKSLRGAALGGVILGTITLILFLATSTDPAMSGASSFPMMDLCARVFPVLGRIYAVLLLLAIFMTQTTVFYGFTTKLGDRKYSKQIAWAVGLAGYVCSLYGYYNFVANIVPIVGYVSLAFFALEIVNLIRVKKQ